MNCRRLSVSCVVTILVAIRLGAQTPGDTAPAFTLKTLDGDSAGLADYRGHPIVINFWGTWCPPCRDEMPLLVAAYHARRDSSLVILAVDGRDQETSTRVVKQFVAEFHMPFPTLLDEHGKVRKLYRLRGYPTTVFVGPDGLVRAVNIGPLSAEALQKDLGEIVAP